MNWKLKLGNKLFKHRSLTPLPIIILVFIIFKPWHQTEMEWAINILGLLVSSIGEIIRILAVGFAYEGTSGRESYLRAENLNTTGIYSIVRNPLYIGNFLIFAGVVIIFSNPYALLIFAVFLITQYYFIILAEENYLNETYGQQYREYCQKVSRIIPSFKGYQKNRNPFNLKKVIFKENDSVFNMLIMMLFVLVYKEKLLYGAIRNGILFIVGAGALIIIYIFIKILKKKS